MFTMAKIQNGSTYLENHLIKNDYYNEKEAIVGQWVGKLAAEYSLEEEAIRAKDTNPFATFELSR